MCVRMYIYNMYVTYVVLFLFFSIAAFFHLDRQLSFAQISMNWEEIAKAYVSLMQCTWDWCSVFCFECAMHTNHCNRFYDCICSDGITTIHSIFNCAIKIIATALYTIIIWNIYRCICILCVHTWFASATSAAFQMQLDLKIKWHDF